MNIILLLFTYWPIYVRNDIVEYTTYYIRPGNVPSYMYRKFNYNSEDIFPHDLRINISISRIDGTLMYSIDRHMNQLILSVSDIGSPVLTIEFRKQTFHTYLKALCNCSRCRYETLDLRIQMRSTIHVQCNGGNINMIRYDKEIEWNDDYPIPFESSGRAISEPNEAHLWLINTPQYGRVYPNNKQLSGCIFNVWYNDEPIIFTNITDNIGRKCVRKCSADICNGGICYETYHKYPICNCTKTFLNGQFCNDSIGPTNIETVSPYLIFDAFKVSWNSSVEKIMELNNSNIQIQLFRKDAAMIFQYRREKNIEVNSIFPGQYLVNTESILIAWFREKVIEAHYLNNKSWYTVILPTNWDLRREIFASIMLLSGQGDMEFVYKTSSVDFNWKRMYPVEFKDINPGELSTAYPNINRPKTFNFPNMNQTIICNYFFGYLATVVITSISTLVCIALVFIGCSKLSYMNISLATSHRTLDRSVTKKQMIPLNVPL